MQSAQYIIYGPFQIPNQLVVHTNPRQSSTSQPRQRRTVAATGRELESTSFRDRHPVALSRLHAFHPPTDFPRLLRRVVSETFSSVAKVLHVSVRRSGLSVRAAEDHCGGLSVRVCGVLQTVMQVIILPWNPAAQAPNYAENWSVGGFVAPVEDSHLCHTNLLSQLFPGLSMVPMPLASLRVVRPAAAHPS